MKNIVSKLRECSKPSPVDRYGTPTEPVLSNSVRNLLNAAADEIERLRKLAVEPVDE